MKYVCLVLLGCSLTACKDTCTESTTQTSIATSPADITKKSAGENPIEPNLLAVEHLRQHLSLLSDEQAPIEQQAFYNTPLSKSDAEEALNLILNDRVLALRKQRQKEHQAQSISIGDKTLKYSYVIYGEKPTDGRSLYISMHGGGGTTHEVNDRQWKNQVKLYQPAEGIYLAPRAPTNTWNLWHKAHIDGLFDRLIENFIAIEGINPNKVFIMGYSAGGDGTYQLAPRMADRWAGAAMMAGHPGDAQTYNLRNLPYFIQCGGKDHAYNRAKLAAEWGTQLDQLASSDPGGYPHKCIVYPQYGHWMNLKCRQAVPWMAKHTRNPWPKKLHWHQDNVTHPRFYWLGNPDPKPHQLITAEVDQQTITIYRAENTPKAALSPFQRKGDYVPLPSITLRLSDQLIDLDVPLSVRDSQGNTLFQGKISRTIQAIHNSIQQRPDLTSAATATLEITLP